MGRIENEVSNSASIIYVFWNFTPCSTISTLCFGERIASIFRGPCVNRFPQETMLQSLSINTRAPEDGGSMFSETLGRNSATRCKVLENVYN
jgi:hypothetical protein